MSNTLILNSRHRTSQNRYEYVFPSNVKFDKGDRVALQGVSLYNSVFNVESQRGNNRISLIWNADTSVQYDWVLPDGFYDVAALNYFVLSQCTLNNLYLVDTHGDPVFFAEVLTQPITYSIQISVYPLPTADQMTALGLSYPTVHSWNAPAVATTPQLIIPSQTFGDLIGFQQGTYPSVTGAANVQFT